MWGSGPPHPGTVLGLGPVDVIAAQVLREHVAPVDNDQLVLETGGHAARNRWRRDIAAGGDDIHFSGVGADLANLVLRSGEGAVLDDSRGSGRQVEGRSAVLVGGQSVATSVQRDPERRLSTTVRLGRTG